MPNLARRPYKTSVQPCRSQSKPLPPSVWEEISTNAIRLRDVTLVTGGGVYLIGLLIWSVIAWKRNLGLLPVLQSQYIAAGFTPSVLVFGLVSTFKVGRLLRVSRTNGQISDKLHKKAFWGSLCLLFLVVTTASILLHQPLSDLWALVLVMLILLEIAFLVGMSLEMPSEKKNTPLTDTIYEAIATVGVPVSLIFCIVMVGVVVLSDFPQEFGGLAPRCAYIEVKRLDLSSEERKALLPPPAQSSPKRSAEHDPTPVVRSLPIDVLYDSGDELELRPHGSTDGIVYEIKRVNIVGIVWCGYEFPKSVSSTKP